MKYARLVDAYPQFAPNPICANHVWRCNPSEEFYRALGYKPVTECRCPDEAPDPGFRWEERWAESEDTILQSWVQVEIPADLELDPEEALKILLGGEEL